MLYVKEGSIVCGLLYCIEEVLVRISIEIPAIFGEFLLFFSVFEINVVKYSAGHESLAQFLSNFTHSLTC
jgi:hypothetical protein